ncbi:MAG: Fe-S-containing protein [Methanomassiliicoccales archaeon]
MENQVTDLLDGSSSKDDSKRSRKRNIVLVITIVVIIIIASMALLSYNKSEVKGIQSSASDATNINVTTIAIPLSFISKNATWYQYNVNGALVRFFAVEGANGTVHTAFDECPYCYPSHQGYRQEGTNMVENCCNMAFPIDQITEVGCSGSGCHPVYLANRVTGDQAVISVSDIAAGAYLFT